MVGDRSLLVCLGVNKQQVCERQTEKKSVRERTKEAGKSMSECLYVRLNANVCCDVAIARSPGPIRISLTACRQRSQKDLLMREMLTRGPGEELQKTVSVRKKKLSHTPTHRPCLHLMLTSVRVRGSQVVRRDVSLFTPGFYMPPKCVTCDHL